MAAAGRNMGAGDFEYCTCSSGILLSSSGRKRDVTSCSLRLHHRYGTGVVVGCRQTPGLSPHYGQHWRRRLQLEAFLRWSDTLHARTSCATTLGRASDHLASLRALFRTACACGCACDIPSERDNSRESDSVRTWRRNGTSSLLFGARCAFW